MGPPAARVCSAQDACPPTRAAIHLLCTGCYRTSIYASAAERPRPSKGSCLFSCTINSPAQPAMRFALLSLALAFALLAATVRADYANFENADDDSIEDGTEFLDNVDEADEADEADEDEEKEECSPEPKTETKTLGGKEIRQETENISVRGRCIRVLKGGSPDDYTTAGSCSRCRSRGSGYYCLPSPLARSLKCEMVLGPDCRRHKVDKSDPTKPCE
ncbi:hypothetical protein BOX15_Mlig034071g1 [Macrostomum lignano]|uniref:Uncharacterized protein n=1 Tax=Macrostomum lignano TaxID=282301 RepID=A0A267DDS7_9PLAT|nr:hypothetical protein BOX15_Mlig034071g1 [Macrostomum lignano]